MKVFLSPSNQTENIYAYGNTNEAVVCGKIAEACKKALERNGIEVMVMHMESMQEKVVKANMWGADLYLPIHTNAFNGQVAGTRMFYYSETGKKAADAIFKYVAPITPGTSENVKQYMDLYECRMPNAYTAYLEVDFHDVLSVAKWLIEHTVEVGEAVAHGICDYFGVTYKEAQATVTPPITTGDTIYRVQVGAFKNKAYADAMLAKVKAAGFSDAYIATSTK